MSERILAGLERAKAQGRQLGRPKKVFDRGKVVAMRKQGRSLGTIAKQLGVTLLLGNLAQQVYEMARGAGLNKEDGSAVVKLYEDMAGVELGPR